MNFELSYINQEKIDKYELSNVSEEYTISKDFGLSSKIQEKQNNNN